MLNNTVSTRPGGTHNPPIRGRVSDWSPQHSCIHIIFWAGGILGKGVTCQNKPLYLHYKYHIHMTKLTLSTFTVRGWTVIRYDTKPPPYKVEWLVASKDNFEVYINLAHPEMLLTVEKNHRVIYQGRCSSEEELLIIKDLIDMP